MFRILWWLFKEVGKEIVIGSIANAVIGSGEQVTPSQYEITQNYPAPQQEQTVDEKAKYYASKFKSVDYETISEKELLGSYYGNRNGKFEVLTITKVQAKVDTLFIKYFIADSDLKGIENVGYILPKAHLINLGLNGIKPCKFFVAKCDLNDKKYFVFGTHEDGQTIEFLSGEK
jgi:hypothetical protein